MQDRGPSRGGRGRGRGGIAPGMRPVSEESRISIADQVEKFRESTDTEYTFEAGLSNHDRAIVHNLSQKYGLKSKSYGTGADRRVTVSKPKAVAVKRSATQLPFSIQSQAAILELFMNFPPTQEELDAAMGEGPPGVASGRVEAEGPYAPERRVRSRPPPMTSADVTSQFSALQSRLKADASMRQITALREKLPIAGFKDVITDAVSRNQVVLIAGETGCGKTTQVPQFLLDACWEKGRPCKILCTQPRRISAMTVAERVATERGEALGKTVGYQIRLDTVGGPGSSLMFCTNGILLRKLTGAARRRAVEELDAAENEVDIDATHIVVDEIHERDKFADFVLIILRDVLPKRPDLRLVLMSATLNADLFARYFGGCPVITVPGFTHPVKSYFLEDVLTMTGFAEQHAQSLQSDPASHANRLTDEDRYAMDDALARAWMEADFEPLMELVAYGDRGANKLLVNFQHSETGASPLMVAAGKGRVDDVAMLLELGADTNLASWDGATAGEWAENFGYPEVVEMIERHGEKLEAGREKDAAAAVLRKYQAGVDVEEVDLNLIQQVLAYICRPEGQERSYADAGDGRSSDDGAVLVFLPGWEEITNLRDKLAASPLFKDEARFRVLPLHSMVPVADQKKVFARPPPGTRKIVLATNIAETAITIDDVVYVIDSGKVKEKSYDPFTNVSTLQCGWISKASARQREGRAGRVRAGVCYHLFSKARHAAMLEFQPPELKRTPLDELGLQVKLLDPNVTIQEFLKKAVEPPNEQSVANAVALLYDIGALGADESLTRLGLHLASLPLSPTTAKMLLHAILLDCLDPALTVACGASYRDPFVLPVTLEQRRKATGSKFVLTESYGGGSDHLALIAAFEGWRAAKDSGCEKEFCDRFFVNGGTMNMLQGMRQQLQSELAQRGFIPKTRPGEPVPCSANARDPGLVRAVLAAGMYPLVGSLLPSREGATGKASIVTAGNDKVRLHPNSVNHRLTSNARLGDERSASTLLVFDEIMRGEAFMYIRASTVVQPHALVLFAAEMAVAPLEPVPQEYAEVDLDDEDAGPVPKPEPGSALFSEPERPVAVVLDRWLRFQTTAVEAAQLYCLRERLAATFAFKIKHPRDPLPVLYQASLYSAACVLSAEGLTYGTVMLTKPPNPLDLLGPSAKSRYATPPPGRGRGRGSDWGLLPRHGAIGLGRAGVGGRGFTPGGRPSSSGRGEYGSPGRGSSPSRRGDSGIYRGGRPASSTRGGAVYAGTARGDSGGKGFASSYGQPRGRGAVHNGSKKFRGGGMHGD